MDWSTVIVAALALAGTLAGSYFSNSKTTALIVYRLAELEKKQEKHNNLIERVFRLEQNHAVLEEKINEVQKDIESLKE